MYNQAIHLESREVRHINSNKLQTTLKINPNLAYIPFFCTNMHTHIYIHTYIYTHIHIHIYHIYIYI